MNRLLNWLRSKSVERQLRLKQQRAWNDFVRARVAVRRNHRAMLAADVEARKRLVGKPYAKRRAAQKRSAA